MAIPLSLRALILGLGVESVLLLMSLLQGKPWFQTTHFLLLFQRCGLGCGFSCSGYWLQGCLFWLQGMGADQREDHLSLLHPLDPTCLHLQGSPSPSLAWLWPVLACPREEPPPHLLRVPSADSACPLLNTCQAQGSQEPEVCAPGRLQGQLYG